MGFLARNTMEKLQAARGVENAIMSIGGAAVLAGGGLISQGISYGLNAKAASTAWDRQKNWATRSATYQRINLENAGYNPIMAIAGGNNLGGTQNRAPQASPAQSQVNMGQLALVKSQIDANEAQARNLNAAADLAGKKGAKIDAELPPLEALAEGFRNMTSQERATAIQNMVRNHTLPGNATDQVARLLIDGYQANSEKFWSMAQNVVDRVVSMVSGNPIQIPDSVKSAVARQALRDVINNPNATGAEKYGAAKILKEKFNEDIEPRRWGPLGDKW